MLRAFILSAATSIGLAATVSVAYGGEPTEEFARMDDNADGVVSASEFLTHMTTNSEASEAEITAWFDEHAGEDGLLSLAEFEAAKTAKVEENEDA